MDGVDDVLRQRVIFVTTVSHRDGLVGCVYDGCDIVVIDLISVCDGSWVDVRVEYFVKEGPVGFGRVVVRLLLVVDWLGRDRRAADGHLDGPVIAFECCIVKDSEFPGHGSYC